MTVPETGYVMTLAVTKGAILGTLTSGSTEESAAR
jgi:hypothetical protein